MWLVVGVRSDTYQRAQPPWRQLGVAVQRQDVAGAGRRLRQLAEVCERFGVAFDEGDNQLLELAALAFPADPALLADAEPARPMQQQKARRVTEGAGMTRIEFADRLPRQRQQGVVVGRVLGLSVGPVAQQRELGVAFRIGQVMKQQAARERGDS